MKFEKFEIEGPLLIKPQLFKDERGVFFESFNLNHFKDELGENIKFVQDNQSISLKNVVRGLHFQKPPFAQGKLVRVVKGSAIDIIVDIRKNSKTFGKHLSVELNDQNNYIFWIPVGFAHGFVSLKDNTIFLYKCTNFYNKSSEMDLLWNDKDLNIDWKVKSPILSEKDKISCKFADLITPF